MYINLDLKVRETKQGGKKLTAPMEGWDQQWVVLLQLFLAQSASFLQVQINEM
jgi:hypothetical protein